jgi:hypothetical protein
VVVPRVDFHRLTQIVLGRILELGPVDVFGTGVQTEATLAVTDRIGKDCQTGRIGSAVAHADQHGREPNPQRIAESGSLNQQPDDAAQGAVPF